MDAIHLVTRIRARIIRNSILIVAFGVLAAAGWGLLAYLAIFRTAPLLAALCTLALIGLTGWVIYQSRAVSFPSAIETSLLIDKTLHTKERLVSATEREAPEDVRALILSQLEPTLSSITPEHIAPFSPPPAARVILYSSPFAWIAALLLIFAGGVTSQSALPAAARELARNYAAEIQTLIDEHPDLPGEIRAELENLKDILEDESAGADEIMESLADAKESISEQAAKATTSATIPPPTVAAEVPPTPTPVSSPQVEEEKKDSKEGDDKDSSRKEPAPKENGEEKKENNADADVQHTKESEGQSGQEQKEGADNKEGGDSGSESGQEAKESGESEGAGEGSGTGQKSGAEQQGTESGSQGTSGQQSASQSGDQGESQQGGVKEAENLLQNMEQNLSAAMQQPQSGEQGKGQEPSDQKGQQSDSPEAGNESNSDANSSGTNQGSEGGKENNRDEAGQSNQGAEKSKNGESRQSEGTGEQKEDSGRTEDREGSKPPEKGGGKADEAARDSTDEQGDKSGENSQSGGPAGAGMRSQDAGEGKSGGGLDGEASFKDARIGSMEEQFDTRYTGQSSGVVVHKGGKDPRTGLSEVELARPEPLKDNSSQPIPLEYEDILR